MEQDANAGAAHAFYKRHQSLGHSPMKEFESPIKEEIPSMSPLLDPIRLHFEHTKPCTSSSYPRYTFYSEKTGVVRSDSFSTLDIRTLGWSIPEILACPFWMDVCQPTPTELNDIARVFGLHPLTNEDIQTSDTREKCEVFPRYVYVVIRSFDQDPFQPLFLKPITVHIVIFEECILSFCQQRIPHTKNVRARIDQLAAYGQHVTPEWIHYALLDDITDSFMPVMKVIETEVDTIEDLVLILVKESEQADMLRRIGMVRKRVMQLLRLMSTKADVLKAIISRYMNQSGETLFYLEDIQDHILTMMQNLAHYEQSLARSHSNYLAQISIEITQASNRTSDTVMRMTILASILVPLNVITGLWGMNVRVPGEDGDNLSWFFGILCLMMVMTLSSYYYLRSI
jgi:magnesium transporter